MKKNTTKQQSIDANNTAQDSCNLRYYTVEETACLLKTTPDKIYRKFIKSEKEDHILFPTVYLGKPVSMRKIGKNKKCAGGEEMLDGYFEINGIYDVEFDDDGYFVLSYGETKFMYKKQKYSYGCGARVMLRHDNYSWIPVEMLRVHKTDLLVSQEELDDYADMMGISLQIPKTEPTTKELEPQKIKTTVSVDEFIKQQRGKGVKDEVIACDLQENYKLSLKNIGKLLTKDDANIGDGSWKMRGFRLVHKKVKK
jgi:hypothetical protein